MPLYTFINSETQETFEDIMSMAEKDEYLQTNPHITQGLAAPSFGDSIRLGLQKPPDSFRDILREIKKKHSAGLTKSTINTF